METSEQNTTEQLLEIPKTESERCFLH